MNAKRIIKYARELREHWGTNDPYIIAKNYGVAVSNINSIVPGFTAHIIKQEGYPTTISINEKYTAFSKKILCAHELGHYLLHEDGINYFKTTSKNIKSSVELEANLFALALLTDEEFDNQLKLPLHRMDNYLLKAIIDYNLKFQ